MKPYIAEIERLLSWATPGPWGYGSRKGDDWYSVVHVPASPNEICQCFNDPSNTDECSANTKLIVALRNNIEQILADLKEAEKDAARYRWLRNVGEAEEVADFTCDIFGRMGEELDTAIDQAMTGDKP